MRRSRFLTHWTGKDIALEPSAVHEQQRQDYLVRLRNILSSGLWMTIPDEVIVGWSERGPASSIAYQAPMTCFTELRLSHSHEHSSRYGLLGIVVDRMFVLERGGGPVQYVRGSTEEMVVGNAVLALEWLHDQIGRDTTGAQAVFENLAFHLAFLKGMSTSSTEDFTFLEEQEWRIVHSYRYEKRRCLARTGRARPKYLIPLQRSDLKMLVVPHTACRSAIFADDAITAWMGKDFPPVLTVTEALHL